jgi:hypothetical protein
MNNPFGVVPGINILLEQRTYYGRSSSICISGTWHPFSRQIGAGGQAELNLRFYTSKSKDVFQSPLFGFFVGPSSSIVASSLGKIYVGNGTSLNLGFTAGNRIKLGYLGFFLEFFMSFQYGIYKRLGIYNDNYYSFVPWITTAFGVGKAH